MIRGVGSRRKKLARKAKRFTPTGMNTWRTLAAGLIATAALQAQVPDPVLPRPGAIVVAQVTGEVSVVAGEERKAAKTDDRLRVGSTVTTGRRSLATLALSNGTTLQLGSESEIELEEFGQAPVSGSVKVAELKEEPTISRTRLRLVRGDVLVEVKPLKVARGSSLHLSTIAGTARMADGALRAMVRMSDLGLGVATLELQKGAAEFELPGAAFAPVPPGVKLAFALEVDSISGVVKVGEMPKEAPKPGAAK